MLSVVALFLLAMAGLGMFGRLRPGGRSPRRPRKGPLRGLRRAERCAGCGRHRVGSEPCPCGHG